MLFNSFQFLLFFPIVTTLYFLLPHRYRLVFLLIASSYFYMSWYPPYILVFLALILIDYSAGLLMGGTSDGARRKQYLLLSLAANLGVLVTFKYLGFFNDQLNALVPPSGDASRWSMTHLILPVGISFHTFQAMAYTIDVYQGRIRPERHLGIFSLFVMFYPQLVAGPIERTQRLIPQFSDVHAFDPQRAIDGLKLMAWGLFKKWVIADRLQYLVAPVYNHPQSFEGISFILATVFFAFQIYCDFSGYSDIAIGAAQVMGFRLSDNFNRPYSSRSVSEFWKRWHISLSSWFRDYVYIPLGGNRTVKWRWYYNVFITFLLSGFWHGANWTFILWGALNGFYVLFSLWTAPLRKAVVSSAGLDRFPGLHRTLNVLTTFGLICFAWIFFRAASLSDAWYIVTHLFQGLDQLGTKLADRQFLQANVLLGREVWEFGVAVAAIVFMELVHAIQRHADMRHMFALRPRWLRWSLYYAMVLGIIFFGTFNNAKFIYFQF